MVEVSIDFETYSECDIKAGAWKYSEHPSTEILCLKYSVGNQQPREYKHGDSKEVLKYLFELIESGCKLRAWNANFERAIWENVAVKKLNWVKVAVEQWIDDMAMAAYYAYPLSLKRCGDALKLEQEHLKDTKGVFLLNKFSKPRKPTKNNPSERTLPSDDPEAYQDLLNYCHQDVKSQQAIVEGLPKQHLPDHEQEAWTLDSKINSNGILIDLKMAEGAIKLLAQHEENLLQELRTLTDGEVQTAKQRDKFLNWLRNNGCNIEDLQKATISNYLSDESLRSNLSEKALKGLQIRQELGLASVAKYKAMIASACKDGRVRGTLQFLGATRTGRFAGRLIQIQNFPRGKHLEDEEIAKIQQADYDYFKNKGASVTKVISNGLRQAIIAPDGKQLGIADYSSIENRVLAWYANDNKSLEDFRTGADQYKVMAASLFNVNYEDVTPEQRFTGKVIILGCGYSMSGKTFHSHANGVFGMDLSLEHAEMYVAKYRQTYNKNVKLWRDLDTAAKQALRNVGKAFAVGGKPNGRVIYKVIGNNLYCRLPSGRNLCYPEAKLVNENGRDQITFKAEIMQKWVVSRTYGGKLCENICQATSRDLLIEALKNLDNNGYKTVAHVHDEILCELEPNQSLDEMINIMVQPPKWAETLPLKAEGFINSRYKK